MGGQDPIARLKQKYLPVSSQDSIGAGGSWNDKIVETSESDPITRLRSKYKVGATQVREEEKPQGLGQYLSNMTSNMFAVGRALATEPDPNESADITIVRNALANRDPDSGWGKALEDFGSIFGEIFKDIGKSIKTVAESPAEFGKSVANDPAMVAGQMAKLFIQPLGDIIEFRTGLDLAGDQVGVLTGEQKTEKIKNAIGFAAMLGTAKLAQVGIKAPLIVEAANAARLSKGLAVADEAALIGKVASTAFRDILTPTQYMKKGLFAKELVRKTTIGSLSGGAYAAVANANEDDQLVEIINNMVTFAPLGMAIDAVGLPKEIRGYNQNTVKAGVALQTRMFQNIEENTLAGVLSKTEALATSKNMLEALVKGTVNTFGDDQVHYFTALTDDNITDLHQTYIDHSKEHRFRTNPDMITALDEPIHISKQRPDGTYDAIIVGMDSPFRQASVLEAFKETGFFPGQRVSHGGKDWIVKGVDKSSGLNWLIKGKEAKVSIASLDGKALRKVPLGDVVHVPGNQAGLNTVMVESPHTLKGMLASAFNRMGMNLLDEFYGKNKYTPTVMGNTILKWFGQNPAAYNNAKTGRPMSVIGFRQGNPRFGVFGGVPGTGRFYSKDPYYATSYSKINDARNKGAVSNLTHWQNFQVHRINFENPIVVDGGHREFIKMIERDYATDFGARIKWQEGIAERYATSSLGVEKIIDHIQENGGISVDDIMNLALENVDEAKALKLRDEVLEGYRRFLGGKATKTVKEWYGDLAKKYGLDERTVAAMVGHAKKDPGLVASTFAKGNRPPSMVKQFMLDIETPPTPGKGVASGFEAEIKAFWAAEKQLRHGEQAYVHKGKIVAKIAKELGHDGIIYRQGQEIVDLTGKAQREAGVKVPQSTLGPETQQRFLDKMYNSFYNHLRADVGEKEFFRLTQEERIKMETDLDAPLSMSEAEKRMRAEERAAGLLKNFVPPPDFNFNKQFNEWAQEKGFLAQEIPALRKQFLQRLSDDLLGEVLDREDKNFIEAIKTRAKENAEQAHVQDSRSLSRYAMKAGYVITREDGNFVTIRDKQGNRIAGGLKTFAEVQDFIQKAGQDIGYALDGGGNGSIPPDGFVGDLLEPPDNTPDLGSILGDRTKMSKVIDTFNAKFQNVARSREYHLSVDSKYGTKLFSRVWDTLQEARKVANARIRPHHEQLRNIEDMVGKMTKAERETIQHYMEKMSPDDVEKHFQMTDVETSFAQILAQSGVDFRKVMTTKRLYETAIKELGADSPELPDKLMEINEAMSINKDDAAVLDSIRKSGSLKNGPRIGPILRYARAMANKETGRKDFAKGMSGIQQAVAGQLESQAKKLNSELGVNPDTRIDPYITHAREYYGGDIDAALRDFGDMKESNQSLMNLARRVGELSNNITDPIVFAQTYIKGAMDTKYFDPMVVNAKDIIKEEMDSLRAKEVPDAVIDKIRNVTRRYVSDIRGIPDADRVASQSMLDHMWKEMNWDKHPMLKNFNTREHLINFISATGEAAAQGFRIAAGMRDFATGMIVSYANFGFKRTGEMLYHGINALKGEDVQALLDEGVIPDSGITAFADPTEYASGVIGRLRGVGKFVNDFNQLAFKMSFQKDIYNMFHAGHYISTFKRSGEALLQFRKGEMGIQEFRNYLDLDTYHRPVIEHYLDLVKNNKDIEASRFLGIQTGQDMIGVYGLANHPSGWNTNFGRVAGQFGQWSMWFTQTLGRMASRGTWGQRGARIARLAAAQKAMTLAGAAAGFNLTRWQPTTGMVFGGGPVIDVWQAAADATSGNEYLEQDGQRRLGRFIGGPRLPFKDGSPQFPLSGPSLLLPGSFAINDLVEAFQFANETGDARFMGRALGVPIQE